MGLGVGDASKDGLVDGGEALQKGRLLEDVIVLVGKFEVLQHCVDHAHALMARRQAAYQERKQLVVETIQGDQRTYHQILGLMKRLVSRPQHVLLDAWEGSSLEVQVACIAFEGCAHGESCHLSGADVDVGVGEDMGQVEVGEGGFFELLEGSVDLRLGGVVGGLGHQQ